MNCTGPCFDDLLRMSMHLALAVHPSGKFSRIHLAIVCKALESHSSTVVVPPRLASRHASTPYVVHHSLRQVGAYAECKQSKVRHHHDCIQASPDYDQAICSRLKKLGQMCEVDNFDVTCLIAARINTVR
eukprot:6182831-Pleurochrysis_carterae.AAC.7